MTAKGFYYLHTNGDLIYKKFRPEDDSPFVKKIWPMNTQNRATAWRLILEALALKAQINRINELVKKWGCDLKDLVNYMVRTHPSDLEIDGLEIYFNKIAECDYDEWLNWLGKTPEGREPDWSTMPN